MKAEADIDSTTGDPVRLASSSSFIPHPLFLKAASPNYCLMPDACRLLW